MLCVWWWMGKISKGVETTFSAFLIFPHHLHPFPNQRGRYMLITKSRVQECNWKCGSGFIHSVINYSGVLLCPRPYSGVGLQWRRKQTRFLLIQNFHSNKEGVTWPEANSKQAHKKMNKQWYLQGKRCSKKKKKRQNDTVDIRAVRVGANVGGRLCVMSLRNRHSDWHQTDVKEPGRSEHSTGCLRKNKFVVESCVQKETAGLGGWTTVSDGQSSTRRGRGSKTYQGRPGFVTSEIIWDFILSAIGIQWRI